MGEQLVQHDAQAIDVAAAVNAVGRTELLGAHVGERAEHLAVERHRGLAGFALGQAEVHDPGIEDGAVP